MGVGHGPSLGSQARRGVAWSGASTMVVSAIGLATNLVLARIIAPSHFGLLGMTTVFTGLIRLLSEMGIATALIRRSENAIDDEFLQTAFWTSAAASVGLFVISSLVLAPLIAQFYGIAELRAVVIVVSIPLLMRPAVVIHRVLLTRGLHFKSLSIIDAISTGVGSAVTIVLALAGLGIWSIALTGTVVAITSVPLLARRIRWSPRLRFSVPAFQEVFSFGSFATGSDAAVFITKNVDYLLIGRLLGANALGIYTLAFLLTDTFRTAIMGVMNKVMYPIYGKLQADVTTLASYYLRVIRYNTLVIVPVMVVLLVLAPALLENLFGPQWLPATGALRFLALSVILHTIGGTSAAVLKSLGRADLEFRINLLTAIFVSVPSLWIGIHWWGITGAGAAAVVHTIVTRFLFQVYMRRLVHISEGHIVRAVAPALMAGLIAASVGIALGQLTSEPGLLFTIALGSAVLGVYLLVCALLLREDVKRALSHARALRAKVSVAR